MLNMLIVDDNQYIVDGVRQLFENSPELDLKLFCAYSPYDALKILPSDGVDIALVDIMMGDMDGFELQGEICAHNPNCKIIYHTAYDRYDYAKRTIRQKAFDYVLKNDGEDDLKATVKKAIQTIQKERRSRELLLNARQYAGIALPMIRRQLIFDLMFQHGKPQNVQEEFRRLDIRLQYEKPLLITLSRLSLPQMPRTHRKLETAFTDFEALLSQRFHGRYSYYSCIASQHRVLTILQPVASADIDGERLVPPVRSMIIREFGALSDSLQKNHGIQLYTEIADRWSTLHAPNVYDVLEERLFNLVQPANDSPAPCATGEEMQPTEILATLADKRDTLFRLFESGRADVILEDLKGFTKKLKNSSFENKLEAYYAILPVFLHYMNKWQVNQHLSNRVCISRLTEFGSHASWEECMGYLQEIATTMISFRSKPTAESGDDIICKIESFIKDNLVNDLSLISIAEHVSYNPSYLSRLYKQLTGKGIFCYVTQQRLARAKEMLLDDKQKIQDIAIALGFENTSNFIRFFKKNQNLTPLEFRSRYYAHP